MVTQRQPCLYVEPEDAGTGLAVHTHSEAQALK